MGADVLQHFALHASALGRYGRNWSTYSHDTPCHTCTVKCTIAGAGLTRWTLTCLDSRAQIFHQWAREKGSKGKTFPVFLCLIAWHRCCKTPIVCLENVVQFPLEVLLAVVSDLYEVHVFEMDTWDSACEHVSRRRVFFLLLL